MPVPDRARTAPHDPWFRQRPALAVGVAVLLYAAVLTLRLTVGGAEGAYSMLYVLPVALLATAFGLRAGAVAGAVAVTLIAIWAVVDDVSLAPLAWTSRVVPLLLLGVLLGYASDRAQRAEMERRRVEAAAQLHRQAIEINDSLVQGMAAAKWSLEAGRVDAGVRTLDDTLTRAQDLVSGLIRQADMGKRTESAGQVD